MRWLFASGHAVDIVLVVLVLEMLWLIAACRWGVAAALLRLGPGALMLIALRGALTGQDWPWIALPLLASFPLNLGDLRRGPPERDRPGD